MTIEHYYDESEDKPNNSSPNSDAPNPRKTVITLSDNKATGMMNFKADGKRFGVQFTADFTTTYNEANDEKRLDDSEVKSLTVVNCVTDDNGQADASYTLTDSDKKSVAIDIAQNIDLYLQMGGAYPEQWH